MHLTIWGQVLLLVYCNNRNWYRGHPLPLHLSTWASLQITDPEVELSVTLVVSTDLFVHPIGQPVHSSDWIALFYILLPSGAQALVH